MDIKEKAKAYDEALKAAVVAHKDEDKHLRATLERIFPELKESEDERMRKHIIKVLKDNFGGEDTDKCIAWLEKQGKQTSSQTNKRTLRYFVAKVLKSYIAN